MVQDSLAVGLAAVLGVVLVVRPAAAAPAPGSVPVPDAAGVPGVPADAPAAPEAPPALRAPPAAGRATDVPGGADAGEADDAAADDAAADDAAAADAALERVLASGCRDGLVDVSGLIGHASAPWARTVLRLCGEVLRRAPRPRARLVETPSPRPRGHVGATDGRGQLVFMSGLYGGWLGVATDVLSGMGDSRALVLPPIVGMAAGLTVSLAMTSGRHVTAGEAWTIVTGLDYGSVNGALWAAGLGFGTKAIVGTSVATSFAAGAVGLAVADARSPSAGQIELCRSGLLWGAVGGWFGVLALAPDASGRAAALTTAIAMDAGFLGGLGVARKVEVSRSRALIIDSGAVGGALFGVGVVWLAVGQTAGHGSQLAGGGLVGLAGGILLAAIGTRNLDAGTSAGSDAVAAGEGTFPALVSRDARGRWHAGTPTPTPLLDPRGARLAGASLSAVGGTF
jgi:hypothetical protein